MSPTSDDLGTGYAGPPHRVVSLVPSLTESLAATGRRLLVGATDYCTHPADLDVARVGGSKWPDLQKVLACAPDLVLANAEENREQDVAALRDAGVAVWVTAPATVPEALASLGRMLAACGRDEPEWLRAARAAWRTDDPVTRTAVIPIWRRPWMVLGRDTFAGDVLRRLGVANAFAGSTDRYPKLTAEELTPSDVDLAVLPDEPYAFNGSDGPEAFPGIDVALVSGRHLTWYGPSLVEAREVLSAQVAAARRYS